VERIGRRGLVGLAVGCALVAAGCTGSSAGGADTVDTRTLVASVTQHRFAEGTPDLLAGITNAGTRDVRITSATIRWPGFAFPTVTIDEPTVPPTQTAAFTVAYGHPRCDDEPPRRATMVADVDGAEVELPLRVEDPGLLVRLHDAACGRQAVESTADVSLVLAPRTARRHGTEVLPGRVVVRRVSASNAPVVVDDVAGSVLFRILPRAGGSGLPARLEPGERRLTLPVEVGSNDRCDAHSRSQSSQTFLFSVYAHVEGAATQRLPRIPSTADQQRLLDLLDRVCAG
jgi:hypothetical protein